MKLTIENGILAVQDIKVKSLVTSSIIFIGDTTNIQLTSWFETPPEDTIVGVTPSLKPKEEE